MKVWIVECRCSATRESYIASAQPSREEAKRWMLARWPGAQVREGEGWVYVSYDDTKAYESFRAREWEVGEEAEVDRDAVAQHARMLAYIKEVES